MGQKIIEQFKGKYRFLSNFYPISITIDGKTFPSTEHYYQAMKFKDPSLQEKIRTAPSPDRAKKIAHQHNPREDWEQISLDVMEQALRVKFTKPELKEKLLNTKDAILQEGNTWEDEFWGVNLNTGEGKNHLGKLLMKIRNDIK
jgi:hypothetical protein